MCSYKELFGIEVCNAVVTVKDVETFSNQRDSPSAYISMVYYCMIHLRNFDSNEIRTLDQADHEYSSYKNNRFISAKRSEDISYI
jgi:hypothetical protein